MAALRAGRMVLAGCASDRLILHGKWRPAIVDHDGDQGDVTLEVDHWMVKLRLVARSLSLTKCRDHVVVEEETTRMTRRCRLGTALVGRGRLFRAIEAFLKDQRNMGQSVGETTLERWVGERGCSRAAS